MTKHEKPIVKDGFLSASQTDPIALGCEQWLHWLGKNTRFVFKGYAGHFTARREARRGINYWYAYRRLGGKLHKTYLGKSEELTIDRLEQAGAQLSGHSPIAQTDAKDGSAAYLPVAARTAPILTFAKIKPPLLPERLIERPRLTGRIKAPATFIYAPSGFGKSTLINAWRQSSAMPVAWVSLDAEDNQPARFWFTLGTALQAMDPELGQVWLNQIQSSAFSDPVQMAAELANEITRASDGQSTLHRFGMVLDDYHHIERPEIHAALQTLLENFPPAMRLVVSSQTRPPLTLGQLRARSVVAELTTDDLRFTPEEGADFLWQYATGKHLSFSEMQTLVKHAEGWVAGLRLATLALAGHTDRQQVMAAFTGAHTYLREYFTENVLYRQPPDVQSFLFKTAILRHLTPELCNAVTGQSNTAEILNRLWQDNIFLARLEESGWYRYHDLFAEMLYSQLQVQFPAEIPRLHRRAAEWYRANNAPADAVYHFLAIQAWDEAASLIENLALRELEQFGEDSRLLRWLQQLPDTVVQQHKTLLFVYIRLAAMALSKPEVDGFLTRVEGNLSRKSADELTTDEQDVLTDTRRLRHVLRTGSTDMTDLVPTSENTAVWRLLNRLFMLNRFSCPDLSKPDDDIQQVYEEARTKRNLFVMLMAGGHYAYRLYLKGSLNRSEKLIRQIIQEVQTVRGVLPEPTSISLTGLARVYFARNQIEQARQKLIRASEVDPNPMSANQPIAIMVLQALIEFADGHADSAHNTLQKARELRARRSSGTWSDQALSLYQAWLYARVGERRAAEDLLDEAGEVDGYALSVVARAEIALQTENYALAEEKLAALLLRYPYDHYHEPIVDVGVMLAFALFKQQKISEARQTILDALRMAAPENFLRPFLDHAKRIAPLLALVLRSESIATDVRAFTKEILRVSGQTESLRAIPDEDELAALSAASSISQREQEVLKLVSAGLSNSEIARRFNISVSTVKTHLDNIYRKLNVNSRTQAAARAIAIGLVSGSNGN